MCINFKNINKKECFKISSIYSRNPCTMHFARNHSIVMQPYNHSVSVQIVYNLLHIFLNISFRLSVILANLYFLYTSIRYYLFFLLPINKKSPILHEKNMPANRIFPDFIWRAYGEVKP